MSRHSTSTQSLDKPPPQEFACPSCGMIGPACLRWSEEHNRERPTCSVCAHDFTDVEPEVTDADAPKKPVKLTKAERIRFPWHSVPPQSLLERRLVINDLEETLADHKLNYEVMSRVLVTSCYALSGLELERVGVFVDLILRGEL